MNCFPSRLYDTGLRHDAAQHSSLFICYLCLKLVSHDQHVTGLQHRTVTLKKRSLLTLGDAPLNGTFLTKRSATGLLAFNVRVHFRFFILLFFCIVEHKIALLLVRWNNKVPHDITQVDIHSPEEKISPYGSNTISPNSFLA